VNTRYCASLPGDPTGSDSLCPYVPEGYDGDLPATLRDDGSGVPDAAD
jgi:hypothetical protein